MLCARIDRIRKLQSTPGGRVAVSVVGGCEPTDRNGEMDGRRSVASDHAGFVGRSAEHVHVHQGAGRKFVGSRMRVASCRHRSTVNCDRSLARADSRLGRQH